MKTNKNFISKIFFLIGEDKKKLPKMVFSFITLSIFDLIGLGLIAPFISLILSSDNSSFDFISDFLTQLGIVINKQGLIILIGACIMTIFFLLTVIVS